MPRSTTKSKPLPPPTRSEAAFELLLASFDASSHGAVSNHAERARGASDFVDQMFARRNEFLARDDFACIGERDSFPTKVMGVSFEGRQDQVAGLVPGLELELKRQPDN